MESGSVLSEPFISTNRGLGPERSISMVSNRKLLFYFHTSLGCRLNFASCFSFLFIFFSSVCFHAPLGCCDQQKQKKILNFILIVWKQIFSTTTECVLLFFLCSCLPHTVFLLLLFSYSVGASPNPHCLHIPIFFHSHTTTIYVLFIRWIRSFVVVVDGSAMCKALENLCDSNYRVSNTHFKMQ